MEQTKEYFSWYFVLLEHFLVNLVVRIRSGYSVSVLLKPKMVNTRTAIYLLSVPISMVSSMKYHTICTSLYQKLSTAVPYYELPSSGVNYGQRSELWRHKHIVAVHLLLKFYNTGSLTLVLVLHNLYSLLIFLN